MLTSLEIEIIPDKTINQHIGSLMHGVLMELLDSDYVEMLHQNSLQPFSQFIYKNIEKDCFIWKINTLNKDAKENIIMRVLNLDVEDIKIKHNDINLKVNNKILKPSISYEKLADAIFSQEEINNIIKLNFLTPTTFKSNNVYTIFPEISNLYVGLLNKWNLYSKEISLSDKDTAEHLISYTKMIDYNLRSTRFYMESTKINSFIGNAKFKVNGPKTLVSISRLLFEYAQFAGLGAKTALGMGGIEVD